MNYQSLNPSPSIRFTLSLALFLGFSNVHAFDYELSDTVYPLPSELPLISTANNSNMPKNNSYTDPTFGTLIKRITDVRNANPPPPKYGRVATGITNEYALIDPENSDGSLVILMGTNSHWWLYNAQTNAFIKKLKISARAEPRWDNTDPNMFLFRKGTKFFRYYVDQDIQEEVFDFGPLYPGATEISSGTKGEPSLDRRYWAYYIHNYKTKKHLDWIVFDEKQKQIVGSYQKATGKRPSYRAKYVVLSPSGKYVVVRGDMSIGSLAPRVFNRDFTNERRIRTVKGHSDFAFDEQGKEVFVAQDSNTDYITMTYLDTLNEVNLMKLPFKKITYTGLHVSGNNYHKPGWALISTYGPGQHIKNRNPGFWADGTHFMLELKENGRHWRIAHTNSLLCDSPKKDYWAEAFATINSLGTRIYWGSNWRKTCQKYTDVYQAILPLNWHSDLMNSNSTIEIQPMVSTPTNLRIFTQSLLFSTK